jgi:hypothetical protein
MISPDELLSQLPTSDVVVLSLPLSKQTESLVDAKFLAAMKTDSVLVNVGRGGLVDEDALLKALDEGPPRIRDPRCVSQRAAPGGQSILVTQARRTYGTRVGERFRPRRARRRPLPRQPLPLRKERAPHQRSQPEGRAGRVVLLSRMPFAKRSP